MFRTRVKGLEHIPVCDGPLSDSTEIKYLTKEEFEVKFGITYTEDLFCKEGGESILALEAQNKSDISPVQVLERSENPLDCLIVAKLDEPIGYSLMTTKALRANIVIGFFHGEIRSVTSYVDDSHHHNYAMKYASGLTVDPEKIGGILRFMPHLPFDKKTETARFRANFIETFKLRSGIDLDSESGRLIAESRGIDVDEFIANQITQVDDFSDLVFANEATKKSILTANVAMAKFRIGDGVYNIVYTTRDIPANSPIGFSYGHEHFLHPDSPTPRLMDKNGIPVNPKSYLWLGKKNPHELYEIALQKYRENQYVFALKIVTTVAQFYEAQSKKPELATCYSTMSSCYRELDQPFEAITFCLNACETYAGLGDKGKFEFNLRKLGTCINKIDKNNDNCKKLYGIAVKLHQRKQFKAASLILDKIVSFFEKKDLVVCLSTMASCARDDKQYDVARDHCQRALNLAKEYHGKDHPKTKKIQDKLDSLEGVHATKSLGNDTFTL